MSDKEYIVAEITKELIKHLSEKCPCGLQEKRRQIHDEHHIFIEELIDFMRHVKKSVLNTFIATVVVALLTLITVGFMHKIK